MRFLGFRIQSVEFKIWGSEFGGQDVWFRIWGLGFEVWISRLRV